MRLRDPGPRAALSLFSLTVFAGLLYSVPASVPAPEARDTVSIQSPRLRPEISTATTRVVARRRPPLSAPVKASAPSMTIAEVTPPAAAVPPSVPADISPADNLAPGSTHVENYVASRGETIPGLARRWLPRTAYMTVVELEAAIRTANPQAGTFLKNGEPVVIPEVDDGPIVEKARSVPRDFEVRAVYLTGTMAGSEKGIRIIREWRRMGGNSVVFDIKDSDGTVNIPFHHPLAPTGHYVPISNLPKFMRFVHSLGMHGIARIAIFRDEQLVHHHPELAVRSRRTGQPWLENGKLVWTDPSDEDVQAYDLALAQAAVAGGADEIQFDYVRFPAESDQKDAKFDFENTHPGWTRADVIVDFLSKAYAQLHRQGVLLSLDVFGVMAWQRTVDLSHTGQDIVRMARYCDVLSPMIYPSHFFGMDGYADPGDAPEHFIGESMDRFAKITAGSGVVLRPWLQAFGWRTKTYSPQYIITQVSAAKARGGIGFLFWNARNDYSKPFVAMVQMRESPGKFFRGDELPRPANVRAGVAAPAGGDGMPEKTSATNGGPLP